MFGFIVTGGVLDRLSVVVAMHVLQPGVQSNQGSHERIRSRSVRLVDDHNILCDECHQKLCIADGLATTMPRSGLTRIAVLLLSFPLPPHY